MWVAGLGWFEFACAGDSLELCVILWLLGGGILGGRCALSASPMPLAYILVRRRDLVSVMMCVSLITVFPFHNYSELTSEDARRRSCFNLSFYACSA